MPAEKRTVGVVRERAHRGFGGVESVVRNIGVHSGDRDECSQYCTLPERGRL